MSSPVAGPHCNARHCCCPRSRFPCLLERCLTHDMLLPSHSRLYLFVLVLSFSIEGQAGLLSKLRPSGHSLWTKRSLPLAAPLQATCKQDSELNRLRSLTEVAAHGMSSGTLLAPTPPPAELAEVEAQNSELARKAFVNLARLSGGKASALRLQSTNNGVMKRAAQPQRAPVLPAAVEETNVPSKHHQLGRSQVVSPSFPYGQVPIRGVNIGGWLVCIL